MSLPAPIRSAVLHRNLKKIYPEAVRGEGSFIFTADGRRILDFSGSAAVNLIGHGDQEIIAAIAAQAAKLEFVHSSQFTTAIAEEYAAELLDFAGAAFRGGQVFFTCGGSESVETALKLARQYQVETGHPGRFRTVSRHQAYHGATLGALAVSGNQRRREIFLPMVRISEAYTHIGLPYCYRCSYGCDACAAQYANELEIAIAESHGTVAAFIAEPVSGATLGAALPPPGYMERVAGICRANGVLFIADEVMTGCGRTGRNFAMDHFHSAPDILALAKGLTSGYMPLGAVIANRKVVDALANGSGSFIHGFTYNGHPLAVAAGQAVLRKMKTLGIVSAADSASRTETTGTRLKASLATLRECASVGDVRGIGLLWGVEFVADKASQTPYPPLMNFAGRLGEAAARRGVMVYPMQGCVDGAAGDHLLIAPSAATSGEDISMAVAVLRDAIAEVESQAAGMQTVKVQSRKK